MDTTNPVFVYWWFHLPNLVLAALMYTLIGRFVLSFIFDPASTNYIWRAFVWMTDPVLRWVSFITPRAVPPLFVLLLAAVWMFAARVTLLVLLLLAGVGPKPGVTG